MSVTLHHGDCLTVLPDMPAESFDAVLTDPPYHLTSTKGGRAGFMSKDWDGGDVAFRPETWALVARAMKPGAHAAIFGGTRTWHRLACAVEDAGLVLRDTCLWVYGTGFPKSLDVSKAIDREAGADREVVGSKLGRPGMAKDGSNQSFRNLREMEGREDRPNAAIHITAPATPEAAKWQGFGTALKPSWEPVLIFRKPLACPTVAAQVLATGTGALNIDGCRVNPGEPVPGGGNGKANNGGRFGGSGGTNGERPKVEPHAAGRWPANLVTDGSPEVLEAFGRFGPARSAGHYPSDSLGRDGATSFRPTQGALYGDTGTAARFFPALGFGEDELRFHYSAKASKADRAGSKHPTVKPVALMRWLCRLVTPPGGTVLDPFAGSGTTGEAALREGFAAVLIEREAEYVADIKRRLARYRDEAPLLAEVAA